MRLRSLSVCFEHAMLAFIRVMDEGLDPDKSISLVARSVSLISKSQAHDLHLI